MLLICISLLIFNKKFEELRIVLVLPQSFPNSYRTLNALFVTDADRTLSLSISMDVSSCIIADMGSLHSITRPLLKNVAR